MQTQAQRKNTTKPSIFLCLSGGGFRASLFHYGCLKRLHEVGLLQKVYAVSATSGGAIVAALLVLCQKGVDADQRRFTYDWSRFETLLFGLVSRGVLGPLFKVLLAYALYLLALAMLLVPALKNFHGAWTVVVFVAGLLSQLSAVRELWHEVDSQVTKLGAIMKEKSTSKETWLQKFLRTILYTFRPSRVRLEALNARAFGRHTLNTISWLPKIYLNAVDLNSGREVAFSQGLVAGFDSVGCRALYEGREFKREQRATSVQVAAAVAASTAFPPIFRPVAVYNDDELKGVFADGGVLDNFAIKLPEAMAAHIHTDRGQRYSPEAGGISSFGDHTNLVLILDGSQSLEKKKKSSWSRRRALFRIIAAMSSEHGSDAEIVATNLERNVQVPSEIVGLRTGFPEDKQLSRYAQRVRTHMDGFSLQECAVLAYCGYYWTDFLLNERPALFDRLGMVRTSANGRCNFKDILPDDLGNWSDDPNDLRRELRFSNHRVGLLRILRRVIGL